MADVSVIIKSADLAYAETALRDIKNGAREAIRSAINDTLQRSKGPLAGELAEEINLGKQRIGRQITITGRPTAFALSGELTVSHAPIRLEEYKPRWTKSGGVTVTTLKRSGPSTFKHGFRQTMASGHKGFYLRERLTVFTAKTTAKTLQDILGYTKAEASTLIESASAKLLYGSGIRKQKRLSTGGNFPRMAASGFVSKLPIRDLMGPSPVAAIEHRPEILNVPAASLSAMFHERLLSKIDWKLSQAGSRR